MQSLHKHWNQFCGGSGLPAMILSQSQPSHKKDWWQVHLIALQCQCQSRVVELTKLRGLVDNHLHSNKVVSTDVQKGGHVRRVLCHVAKATPRGAANDSRRLCHNAYSTAAASRKYGDGYSAWLPSIASMLGRHSEDVSGDYGVWS